MLDSLIGNNPLTAIIAFFIVLVPLILIHELGHFLAAKAVGITILEFGIGFPPRVGKLFTWRGTEFTLNWLPIGGFVRPLGEDMIRPVGEVATEKDRAEAESRQDGRMVAKAKAVHEANPIQRIFFMAAGAVANFIFAFILFTIVASIGIQQAVGGSVGVIGVKAGSVFEKAGIQNGDTILELNSEKFDDSTQFFSRLHSSDAGEASLTIQKVGTGQRETITLSAISPNAPLDTKNYVQISGIVKGAPSEQAGMMPGDLVTAFNGEPIAGTKEFREKTKNNLGKEVAITLQRGQETLIVKLTPRTNPPARQGAIGILISDVFENTNLGFLWQEGDVQRVVMPLAFNQSVQYGIERVVSVITTTVQIPSQLVSGVISADEARPVSVIGMSQIGGGIIEHSIRAGSITPILDFIGVISVALGFFNLLPIPALDGGRILFVLIEIARGRPVAPEREGFVHLVGLALLLSLSAVIILNDVVNPITNILR